jgi:hypothetical protein
MKKFSIGLNVFFIIFTVVHIFVSMDIKRISNLHRESYHEYLEKYLNECAKSNVDTDIPPV